MCPLRHPAPVHQGANAFDCGGDQVAVDEEPETCGADPVRRAGEDEVSGAEGQDAGEVADQSRDVEDQIRGAILLASLTVYVTEDQKVTGVGERVSGDDDGPIGP